MRHRRRSIPIAALAAILLAATTPDAAAQARTTFGVRGGVSVASASLDPDDTFDEENRTGIVGGPFLDFDLGILGFQVAGLYHEKGFEEADETRSMELAYFELPAVLKVGVPLPFLKPSLFGGVAPAFETKCELGGVDCDEAGLQTEGTDWSAVFGADVAVHLGPASLWADGRYDVGLSDIHDAGDPFEGIENRAWSFTAGIGFGI